jgi:hypothetical protein
MKASEFIEHWIEFSKETQKYGHWDDSKCWTINTIGMPICEKTASPLGKHIADKRVDLVYGKEDKNIDLSFFKKDSFFSGIKDMNYEARDSSLYDYFISYEVILEHENSTENAYQEMTKLTAFKSKLKVLITYDYDDTTYDNDLFTPSAKHLISNFSSIIKQTNDFFSENPETEYLLIIGRKLTDELTIEREKGKYLWKFAIYNTKGDYEIYKYNEKDCFVTPLISM